MGLNYLKDAGRYINQEFTASFLHYERDARNL